MQIRVSFLVPHSEYRRVIEDLFQTSLTDYEAGVFIFNKKCKLQDGIILVDPRRTLKEAIEAPQTITFLIDIVKGLGIGIATSALSKYLFSKLQKSSWLKIEEQESKITLDDIQRVIRDELTKKRNQENLCNDGKCSVLRKTGELHTTHQVSEELDYDIKDSNINGFNELMIDVTKQRIAQELAIFTSLRIRAGIAMAAAGIILNLMVFFLFDFVSLRTTKIFELTVLNQNLLFVYWVTLISGILSMIFLFVSVIAAFFILVPRKKLGFIDPKQMNNILFEQPLNKSFQTIKSKLMGDLKLLQEENEDVEDSIKVVLKLLIFGVISLFILLISSGGKIVESVTGG